MAFIRAKSEDEKNGGLYKGEHRLFFVKVVRSDICDVVKTMSFDLNVIHLMSINQRQLINDKENVLRGSPSIY